LNPLQRLPRSQQGRSAKDPTVRRLLTIDSGDQGDHLLIYLDAQEPLQAGLRALLVKDAVIWSLLSIKSGGVKDNHLPIYLSARAILSSAQEARPTKRPTFQRLSNTTCGDQDHPHQRLLIFLGLEAFLEYAQKAASAKRPVI
jgi:hypothetical protein